MNARIRARRGYYHGQEKREKRNGRKAVFFTRVQAKARGEKKALALQILSLSLLLFEIPIVIFAVSLARACLSFRLKSLEERELFERSRIFISLFVLFSSVVAVVVGRRQRRKSDTLIETLKKSF